MLTVLVSGRRRKLQALAAVLVAVAGASGCRSHSATAPVPQPAATPAWQLPAQARVESEREESCREFVQGFYDWYLRPIKRDREHPDGELGMDDAIRMKRSAMSGELYSSLKADRDAQAHAKELVGLDFDPFTNSQDNSPKFEVKSTAVQGDDCRAVVWGVDTGIHRETVEPEAKEEDGAWRFVNFHYRYESQGSSTVQDSNLVEILKGNASNRKRNHD